ncbi:MAG: transketolase C-terminal domain-containing protein [Candidatus Saccharimonas sp.]
MYPLNDNIYTDSPEYAQTRAGFGHGLRLAAEQDESVVGLCADLVESVKMNEFADAFPERYIEVGIAEQNLATVASGLARAGKIPFAASYAAFHPGRSWEQIKATIALNDVPVKIVGGHSGCTVGPDGATHQMFEDIALMRVLPNMTVICPGDSVEAEKATQAVAQTGKPAYLRLARDKTPVFSTNESPFEIGRAYVLREGHDVTIASTGILTGYALRAAQLLQTHGISAEIVHVPTVKPLDEETILNSIRKTGRVVSAEDAQAAGGLGGAIAELLGDKLPTPLLRIGMPDRFGESGEGQELIRAFGFDEASVADKVGDFVDRVPKYHQGF